MSDLSYHSLALAGKLRLQVSRGTSARGSPETQGKKCQCHGELVPSETCFFPGSATAVAVAAATST